LSHNTITKYLNAGTIEPQITTPERQSKVDPFADKLTGWSKTEVGRARKQRRTPKQLNADLVVLGFTGSYVFRQFALRLVITGISQRVFIELAREVELRQS